MALTSKQRAALRSAANTMDPVYQIGKGEIDDTLKQGIADCIAARELIKVKVLENSEYSAREAADILCEALDCECVQVIGRKFVLFKQKKKGKRLHRRAGKMKTLLYGGTFDPPHNGHMNNLRAALALVQPDRALVMPAGTPPHKHASATPAELRLQMCACFTALSPGGAGQRLGDTPGRAQLHRAHAGMAARPRPGRRAVPLRRQRHAADVSGMVPLAGYAENGCPRRREPHRHR